MKLGILVLGVLAASSLSACGTVKGGLRDISSWGSSLEQAGQVKTESADVHMREDTGDRMTPLAQMDSVPMGYSSNSGYIPNTNAVDLYTTEGQQYRRSNYSGATMPSFSGGVRTTGDSSVTIFSLDGPAPMMGQHQAMAPMQQHHQQPVMNQHQGYNDAGSHRIYFQHGSSRLGQADMVVLSGAAEQAKFAPVDHVTVSGYASPQTKAGSHSVRGQILNLKESMNRSFEASKTLIQKGVPAEKIKTVSWGAAKPTGNVAQDRRVEIFMGDQ